MEAQQSRTIRYKLVCEQKVFCYRDVRSYVYTANYPKSLPFALKEILAFEIHWVMFSLLRFLLLPSPSIFFACAFEFQVGVLAPEDFSVSNLPLRGLPVRRSYVSCSVCMRIGLRFIDSKHCFADDEKTAFHECFGRWWEFEIAFSRRNVAYCMTSWRSPSDIYK